MEHVLLQDRQENRKRKVRVCVYRPRKRDGSDLCLEEDRFGTGKGGTDGEPNSLRDKITSFHELPEHR